MGAVKAFEADVANLGPDELKRQWSEAWRMPPPPKIGRTMLEKSLAFKLREQAGLGLTPEQQQKLNRLIVAYKRNPVPLASCTCAHGPFYTSKLTNKPAANPTGKKATSDFRRIGAICSESVVQGS